MDRGSTSRRTFGTDPVANFHLRAICRKSPARITSGSTAKAIPEVCKASEIDLDTRIISTADVFDALTAERPYRAAMPVSKALAILWEGAGASHDPRCIEALQDALRKAEWSDAA